MQLYILNANYELLGELSEQEDIVFNKRFNDVGYCALKVACDNDMLSLLQRGNYIYRYDDDFFCKIETVTLETDIEQGDYFTIDATDMNSILSGRIVRWEVVYSGTVAGFIKRLVYENCILPTQPQRAIPNFIFDDSNFAEFTETINISRETATKDLLQLIITTCKTYNYGFRVSFDISSKKLVFRLIKGKNKATMESAEYIEFSPNYANIISSKYKEDESNYKNLVYVGYKGEDEKTHLLSLFTEDAEPTGEDRKEVYIDGTSTSRDISVGELELLFGAITKESATAGDKTTAIYYATIDNQKKVVATSEGVGEDEKITANDYTYLLLIRIVGLNTLAERKKTQEFSGEVDTVDTYEYKKDYNLGDIVKVANEYGIEAAAQIIEVTESESSESPYSVEPIFEYIY